MDLVLNSKLLALPDDLTPAEVLARIIEALGFEPKTNIALADETGYGTYVRGEPDFHAPWLEALIRRARVAPARVDGVKLETCSHGSPGIPGQGFLCGWC